MGQVCVAHVVSVVFPQTPRHRANTGLDGLQARLSVPQTHKGEVSPLQFSLCFQSY